MNRKGWRFGQIASHFVRFSGWLDYTAAAIYVGVGLATGGSTFFGYAVGCAVAGFIETKLGKWFGNKSERKIATIDHQAAANRARAATPAPANDARAVERGAADSFGDRQPERAAEQISERVSAEEPEVEGTRARFPADRYPIQMEITEADAGIERTPSKRIDRIAAPTGFER